MKRMELERLEERTMLACAVAQHGSALLITAGGDEVNVGEVESGDMGVICFEAGTVDVTFEDEFAGVRRVSLRGGPEDDYFGIYLTGETQLRIDVSTGDGFDSVDVNVVEVSESLQIRANLGNDDDWFSFLVHGDVFASLTLSVTAGNGDDYVEVTGYGQIVDGRSRLTVSLGAGDDEADLFLEPAIDARPTVVQLSGGSGSDALFIDQVLMDRGRVRASQFEDLIVTPSCALDDPDCIP